MERLIAITTISLAAATAVSAATSWYEAAGVLAAGVAASKAGENGVASDVGGAANGGHGGSASGKSGVSRKDGNRNEDISVREDAERFRETMRSIVAEYDKIGAGELARQCIDASRIVQIAENPSGWREILFLLAGLVSLIAALFITKILASMFKVEIAQLLWIPIAACIAVLVGLFVAIRAAKKRKVAVAAGVALSAAGVISFVDPVRHAFFGIVADIFLIFTAWYVPIVASVISLAGLLFVFLVLLKHLGGDWLGSVVLFVLRNAIGFVAIPGVCAFLFLAILSVVGPWFEGHAGELATTWEDGQSLRQSEVSGASASWNPLRLKADEEEREFENISRLIGRSSSESESEAHAWSNGHEGRVAGTDAAAHVPNGEAGRQSGGYSRLDVGATPFSAYPREIRKAAVEMARAAEGVYHGTLPRGAKPFDGFLGHSEMQSIKGRTWNRRTGTFSSQSGLVAQVFQRRTGWRGAEMVVVFRGTADAKDGLEDWRQLFGERHAPQYVDAAALVRLVRESTDLPLVVLGHSLGGGQTQYGVAMNQGGGDIRGVGFNPAGLSSNSVRDIEMRRGEGDSVRSAQSLAMIRLDNDPISTAGVLLGRVVFVASGGIRGLAAHSITTLAEAMEMAAK